MGTNTVFSLTRRTEPKRKETGIYVFTSVTSIPLHGHSSGEVPTDPVYTYTWTRGGRSFRVRRHSPDIEDLELLVPEVVPFQSLLNAWPVNDLYRSSEGTLTTSPPFSTQVKV